MCYARSARVQLEPGYHWDNYHSSETEREDAREGCAARTERDVFEYLAWLYEEFTPAKKIKGGSKCES